MPAVELNGLRIAYEQTGRGEPVILLHSSACSRTQWTALGAQLAHDFNVLAPDLHGYGESDPWPDRGPLRLADETAIVEALAGTCRKPVHLVGHSFGGAVALKAALDGRFALRSLTLVEPVAFHILGNGAAREARYFAEVLDLAHAVKVAVSFGDYSAAMSHFVDYWNGAGSWSRLSPSQQDRLLQAARKLPQDFHAAIGERKRLEDYCRLTAPTLIMSGTESPAPVRRVVRLLGASLPNARTRIVQGAGHMLPLTHRDEVNGAIAEHLALNREDRRQAA